MSWAATKANKKAVAHETAEPMGACEDRKSSGRYDLSALWTRAEVFGYCIEVARRESWDEVEVIDALLKVAIPWREDVREVERVLRPLGYIAVADHLRRTCAPFVAEASKPLAAPDGPTRCRDGGSISAAV